jgi:hypothetical protein
MTIWAPWQRFDFDAVVNSGRIPEGTPVKISKRPTWLPSWMARLFTNPNANTAVIEWPGPGVSLGRNVQAVAFEAGTAWPIVASQTSRGF